MQKRKLLPTVSESAYDFSSRILDGKDSKFDSHKKEPLSTVPNFKYWNYNPCLRV
jgi:hypothetical protein